MALFQRKKQSTQSASVSVNSGSSDSEFKNGIEAQGDFFDSLRKQVEKRREGETISKTNVWHRIPKEYTMLGMVLIIVLIFVFFFLSPILFTGGAKDVGDPTVLGEEVSLSNGASVTVQSWKYSAAQGMMEIKMTVQTDDYAASDVYDFIGSLKHGNEDNLSVEAVVTDNNYIVLLVRGLPEKWTALRIDFVSIAAEQAAQKKNQTKVDSLGQIMCLQKKVSQVSRIIPKTANEYRADVFLEQIPAYQSRIDADNQKIQEDQQAITNIDDNLDRLAKQAGQPMPKSQLKQLYQEMTDARGQRQELQGEIQGLQQDIQEQQTTIAKLRAQASYYQTAS